MPQTARSDLQGAPLHVDAPADAGPEPSLRIQDIADRLALAGLAPEDSRVYVHLVVHGPRAAGILARELRLNRPAVYRILARLGESDLVRADGGHPTLFTPAPIDHVLDDLVATQQARVRDLERLRGRIVASIESLRRDTQPAPTSILKVVRGRQDILLIADLMIREATKSLHVALTDPHAWAVCNRAGAMAHIMRRRNDGIEVVAVAPGDATEGASLSGEGTVTKARSPELLNIIVADRSAALMWVVLDGSQRLAAPGDQAMWSNEGSFGEAQALHVEALGGTA